MHRTSTLVVLAVIGLFTTAVSAQNTFVFINSGQALGNSDSYSVALGDLDGDGDLDAMVTNNFGQPNTVWFAEPDRDGDGDGVGDTLDGCPDDPNKTEPGVCGCGVPDIDTDLDGVLDCVDGCPLDPNKTEPGNCGCGVADTPGSGVWDLDCDGDYDEDDIRLAMAEYGITEGTPGDMDGDGDTDRDDWELLGAELGICLGDINGDGQVDAADLGLLIGAWGLCP